MQAPVSWMLIKSQFKYVVYTHTKYNSLKCHFSVYGFKGHPLKFRLNKQIVSGLYAIQQDSCELPIFQVTATNRHTLVIYHNYGYLPSNF